ncbi:hypothetical protein SAMN04487949_3612 [Halogranum gelatinilyticum]|uniref:Uncharacterized protein n=1 Tax=Halogranum gelatinilyticum TaxID=660521 RepID=A0A1G9ZF58_9EURY|nr:hypothetical protein [Halogranum gelatinilyticum]SDN19246.1 hypothetical protein SAMN04487949_3612 [Halogranum gelatinilyticum]
MDLRTLRAALLSVLAVVAAGGSVVVGVTPNGWNPLGGVVLGFVLVYLLLRRVVGAYLTEVQRWGLFALFGVVSFLSVATYTAVYGGSPDAELVVSVLVCLLVSALFGYRARARVRSG